MVNCAVINCKNSSKKVSRVNDDVSFHSFPNDPKIKEKWIDATGNKNWFPTKQSKICSIHFNKDDFCENTKLRRLYKIAFPTINILQRIMEGEKEAGGEQITDHQFSSSHATKDTPSEGKLEDSNEPGTPYEPFNSPNKRKLLHKLNLAQNNLKQKEKVIKRLREQNRRKAKKILALVTLLDCLKKKSFIYDAQLNSLNSIYVTTKELYSRQLKNERTGVLSQCEKGFNLCLPHNSENGVNPSMAVLALPLKQTEADVKLFVGLCLMVIITTVIVHLK